MASVNKDSKGWRVLFVDPNGDRKQLRPGKGTNKATAQQVGRHVDELVAYVSSKGTLARQTAMWLGEIGDTLHAKLAKAGLVEPRHSGTLAEFIAGNISCRSELKPRTIELLRQVEHNLVGFFGSSRKLRSITPADAADFRR